MKSSRHYCIDKYGCRYAVEMISENDDIVVFGSTPKLSFDLKEHGIKIRRAKHDIPMDYDYILIYVLKDGKMFFRGFEAHLSFWSRSSKILGVAAEEYNEGKWSRFIFDDISTDYSGTLSIGKDFDYRYWKHEDKARPVPFSPEVYKENGYIKIENGAIVAKELHPRDI